MKILALSDKLWPSQQLARIKKFAPDIVALAGDVSWKGLYAFLKAAGRTSKVLVVAGNHDECASTYDSDKINRLPNCEEISDRLVEAAGFRFFGLPYSSAMDDARLAKLMPELRQSHVLITHAPLSRLPKYCWRGPKVIIQGHHGYGVYFTRPILTVFTDGVLSALIDWQWPFCPSVQLLGEEGECVRFSAGKLPPPEVRDYFEEGCPCPPKAPARRSRR
jgi:predicted phosphodiesterase